MRLIYDNQIDALAASEITALTETTLYEATQVQDQRLTTQWKTTAATDQTIIFNAGGTVTEGESAQPMFQATTNRVTDPENLTSANWTATALSVATAAATIAGIPAYLLTATSASSSLQNTGYITTATHYSILFTARESSGSARCVLRNTSAGTNLVDVSIAFATKTLTYANGTAAFTRWIDDDTVIVGAVASAVSSIGNKIATIFYPSSAGTTAQSTIYSAPIVVANSYPLAYTATTRSAWATAGNVSFRIPPSGKFIIDCEFFPYYAYTTINNQTVFGWYGSATQELRLYYQPSTDGYTLRWNNAGTVRTLTSALYDAGTSYRKLNQKMRIVISLDISTSGITTGSRMFLMAKNGSYFAEDDTSWSGAITALSGSAFTVLELGKFNGGDIGDILMSRARIRGGTLDSVISTEADLDAELKTKPLLYETEYQGAFDVDTVAIMGHTITAGADVKVQLNDWNEWNYVDGSGSSIIQHTMSWDEDMILTFLDSKVKRQYVKFSINDPGNEAGTISIGRIWIGDYLDVSPSALLNFTVTKKRSDRRIYGRNRQKWAEEGVGWRQFDLSFPRSSASGPTSMIAKIARMYDTVGLHDSLIFANFDTVRDYEIVEPVYCSITTDLTFTHTRRQRYEYRLSLEEDK